MSNLRTILEELLAHHLVSSNPDNSEIISQVEQKIKRLMLGEEEIEGEIVSAYNDWLSTTNEINIAFKEAATAIHSAMVRKMEV